MQTTYRKIMVPLDGSDLAEQALPHARMIAEQQQSRIVLFSVAPDVKTRLPRSQVVPELLGIHQAPIIDEQPLVDDAFNGLNDVAETLRVRNLKVDVVVEVGSPADRIIDYAAENNVDLIVMSTHGRSGIRRWMYGSIAHKVMGHAVCPVLLVRVTPEDLAPKAGG